MKKINFPSDPMAYKYISPSNIFPQNFSIKKKYKRTSWESNVFIYLHKNELIRYPEQIPYIPSMNDIESNDWEYTKMTTKEIEHFYH